MASMGPRRAARSLPCLQNGACAIVPSPTRKEPGRSRRPPGTAGSQWAFEPIGNLWLLSFTLLLLSILEDIDSDHRTFLSDPYDAHASYNLRQRSNSTVRYRVPFIRLYKQGRAAFDGKTHQLFAWPASN